MCWTDGKIFDKWSFRTSRCWTWHCSDNNTNPSRVMQTTPLDTRHCAITVSISLGLPSKGQRQPGCCNWYGLHWTRCHDWCAIIGIVGSEDIGHVTLAMSGDNQWFIRRVGVFGACCTALAKLIRTQVRWGPCGYKHLSVIFTITPTKLKEFFLVIWYYVSLGWIFMDSMGASLSNHVLT